MLSNTVKTLHGGNIFHYYERFDELHVSPCEWCEITTDTGFNITKIPIIMQFKINQIIINVDDKLMVLTSLLIKLCFVTTHRS